MRVGFIGLGDQGAPMARAIGRSAHQLFVWARRPESLASIADVPHTVCGAPAELGSSCELVGLCLREDRDVEDVVFEQGLLDAMPQGSVLANHGTGSPDVCEKWADRALAAGVRMLDAPVSGGRAAAEKCTLTTMVGGDVEAASWCDDVFDTFSRLVVYLGPPGSGQLVKLMNNALMAANLKNAQEVLALASRLGLDRHGLVEVLLASSGASFSMEAMAKHMTVDVVGHYEKMVGKDVGHLSEALRVRQIEPNPIEASARAGVDGMVDAAKHFYAADG